MTSKPATPEEQLLALNERMNTLENDVRAALGLIPQQQSLAELQSEIQAALSDLQSRLDRDEFRGPKGDSADLKPLQQQLDAALSDLQNRLDRGEFRGPKGDSADLAPLRHEVETMLTELDAARTQLLSSIRDSEARAERAIAAVSLLTRQERL